MVERQFNFPRRQQRVVVTGSGSAPIWAVNIGACAAPSLSVAAGVITGQSSGIAALLSGVTFTRADVTDGRETFMRMDDGGAIADGTLIQLQRVSGKMCCVFANCAPTTGLTGLEADPE